jgi:TonB family protein
MRRVLVRLTGLLTLLAVPVSAEIRLPPPDRAVIVGARAVRQVAGRASYDLTLASGKRVAISTKDVHEEATALMRTAVSTQAPPPIDAALVFVLVARDPVSATGADLDVTLQSGATVHLGHADYRDARLTFLWTALAEAYSRAKAAEADFVRALQADYLEKATAKIRENWQPPEGGKGTLRIRFVVQRDGRITDIKLEESLGEAFDLAAMRAVMLAGHLAPLPPEFPDKTLSVTVVLDAARK